ncbi:Dolichol-phosphate mannosyltransferase subunit 3 [Dermatophagoides pteronyssinus]|uniref:Dolichol-phosphate mannosyltransferase subunit 3 n=1 Tax=Dermatophagoides pteronyssinus TaxID=6956 RepID=A0ABQ8JJD2_DERPT|nr:Dolichol-phosphate mannosyltransferase subunit 3 [Dermatophagoides pteronyssinus]
MTRLTEALVLAVGLFGLWIRLLTIKETETYLSRIHLQLLPIYTILVFGLISAIIVLYRTLTFNGCPEAYEELKIEIKEAKNDLKQKGFKF